MKKLNRFLVAAMAALIVTPVMAMNVLADTVPDDETDKAVKIKIDSNNFPDKEFRTYIKNIDLTDQSFDGDGYLSSSEIKLIKKIEIDKNENIKNITGVDNLTSLTTVSLTNCPLLEGELDLTGNANVKTIILKNDGISSIKVNKDKITKLTIDDCSNMTGTFSLTSYTSLKEFEAKNSSFTKISMADTNVLTSIKISNSAVTSIGLKSCNKLTYLNVSGTAVKSLNLSECKNLKNLNVEGCSKLTSIDISNCDGLIYAFANGSQQKINGNVEYVVNDTDNESFVKYTDGLDITLPGLLLTEKNVPDENLRYLLQNQLNANYDYIPQSTLDSTKTLNCSDCYISSLEGIQYLTNLEVLRCRGNDIAEFDVSKNTKLSEVYCPENKIQNLILGNKSTLTKLDCEGNKISSLDLSGYSNLKTLYAKDNELLENINVKGCKSLTVVRVSSPLLRKVDLTGITTLEEVYVSGLYNGRIDEVILDSNLSELTDLTINYGSLTNFEISDMQKLEDLTISYSKELTSLKVKNCPNLGMLVCDDNPNLVSLEITGSDDLISLICMRCNLKSLDVSKFKSLNVLQCDDNQLTELDVTGLPLYLVSCSDNNLKSIKGLGFPLTYEIRCADNNLTEIDVSKCTYLRHLNCSNNELNSLTIGAVRVNELWCFGNNLLYIDIRQAPIKAIMTEGIVDNKENTNLYYVKGDRIFIFSRTESHSYMIPTDGRFIFADETTAIIYNDDQEIPTPTPTPTAVPTPTTVPTAEPTKVPTATPSKTPTAAPTVAPSGKPTATPTMTPTVVPGGKPTSEPTKPGATVTPSKPGATNTPSATPVPGGATPGSTTAPKPTLVPGATNAPSTPTATPTPKPSKPQTGVSDKAGTVEDFAERLYTTCLDREAEKAGKDYWVGELKSGKPGSEVAQGFFFSPEFIGFNLDNEEYITRLYRTFMGREPDKDGMNYWLSEMKNGQGRVFVFDGFVNSPEWADICLTYGIRSGGLAEPTFEKQATPEIMAFAERLYTTCLGRDAEPEGLKYWAQELANLRQTGTVAASGFFNSPEFIGLNTSDDEYVTRLYKTFMGRDPEKAGFEFWTSELKDGKDRQYVFDGFSVAPEFANLCAETGIMR